MLICEWCGHIEDSEIMDIEYAFECNECPTCGPHDGDNT
ncbi:hypothetical protein J2Z26_000950 [Bacillus luteolus]|nr:hypothetical protein [Cytobacillus luteolus]